MAQVISTVYATGTTGSYATGSVNSAGTKNDGNMVTINSSTNRGWAVFDLSSIPSGAIINSVTLKFTTYSTTLSSATNNIYGYAWTVANDPATYAGASLYSDLGSGTSLNASSWTANALQTKTLNATAVTLVSNNIGGKIVLGFVRGSTNTYNIYGYPAANAADQPQLDIDYTPTTPCNGTPNTPVVSGPASICPNVTFLLSSTGATLGSGMTYQWESAPMGSGSWTPISGATNVSYSMTGGISVATDFHLVSTCANGGASSTSNDISVTVNSFYGCYCTPASTCTNEGIESVDIGSFSNTSTFCNNTSGYTSYTGLGSVGNVSQAQVVPISVTAHINSNPASAGVWIDYDHSGTFDASEYTSLGSATVTIPSGGTSYTFTGNITIAANAMTGVTGMRVRSANQGGITSGSACVSSGVYGEFEDYLITIDPGTPCFGSPVAGTITGPSSICSGVDFTLSANGYTNGVTGLTYEWQVYNTGTSSWDPAPGTNNMTSYTATGGITAATDYRFVITCLNGGGVDYSPTQSITINPVTQCYCIPVGASATYGINSFVTTGAVGNINNTNSGLSPGGYGDFTAQILQVVAGSTVNFTTNFNSGTNGFVIFVDWDVDGSFSQSGDKMYNTTSYQASGLTGSFTVPATATGTTRMRIHSNWLNSNPSTEYCATNTASYSQYAEWEDYTVTIVPPPTCIAPTNLVVSNIGLDTADLTWNASSSSPANGYEYYVSTSNTAPTGSTTATGSTVAGDTTATLNPLSVQTTYYVWVRSDCGGGDYSVWQGPVTFNTLYCTPASNCTNEGIENVTFATLNNTSTYCNNTSGYTNYTSLGSLATVTQAQQVPISVTAHINSNPASAGVWIDYDHNGVFDASEYTSLGSAAVTIPTGGTTYIFTGNINIDAGALTGDTRMRVRSSNQGSVASNSACTSSGIYGEFEDYLITISTGTPCGALPTAGTATSSLATISCSGTPFTLSATGYSTGVTGLSFQWQESSDGLNYTNLGSASPNYSDYTVSSISQTMYYKLEVTCSNGGAVGYSNDVMVTFATPSIPWTENFDALTTLGTTSFPSCWLKENGDWASSNATTYNTAHSGANYLRDSWSATNEYVWTPGFSLTAGTSYDLSFYVQGDGYTGWNVDIYQNASQSSTGATSIGSFTATGSGSIAIQQYEKKTFTFVPGSTGVYYFGIRVNQTSSTPWYIAFDDFRLELTPACSAPTNVTTSNIGITTADISWTASISSPTGGYEYYVDTSSTAPNAGTTPTGSVVAGDTMASVSLLTAQTTYHVWVRSDCGGGSYSPWEGPATFTTLCNAATGPLNESFNASSTPLCWFNSGPELWLFSTGSGPGYGVSGSTDHTGNGGYFAWVDGSGTGSNQDITLTAVPVDVAAFAAPNLSYYMKSYNVDDGALNKLLVQAFDGTDWINIDSVQMNFPSSAWYNRQVLLAPFSLPNPVQIRFVVDESNNVNGSSFYNDILLDDVFIVDGPLAVKLGDINAVNVDTRNRIDWNTVNEDAGDYFILERSADGRNFAELATVHAKGEPSTYSYWDTDPVSGINYYRLKMTDAAGKNVYSKVVTATVKGANGFTVEAFPNPVTDVLTVKVYGIQGDNAAISVSDVTGKVLSTTNADGNSVAINMSRLPQGIYFIKYTDANHTQTIKVNKQ